MENIAKNRIILTTDIEGGKIGIKELYKNSLKIMP